MNAIPSVRNGITFFPMRGNSSQKGSAVRRITELVGSGGPHT